MDQSNSENPNEQGHTHLPHAEQTFENHEQTDVSIRPLVWTLGAIAAVLVFSYVGMWGLFELFESQTQGPQNNPRLTNVETLVRRVPEGVPALQGVPARDANANTPVQDMNALRDRNTLVMRGERPMREGLRQPGMPIGRAIDEAVARKIFTTRAAAPAAGGDEQGEAAPGGKPGETSASQPQGQAAPGSEGGETSAGEPR